MQTVFIENCTLVTRCQSVSVVAVSDIGARYVICALSPIWLLTYLRACSEFALNW